MGVWGLIVRGFGVQRLGLWGLEFRGLEFRGSGLEFRGLGFRVNPERYLNGLGDFESLL